MKRKRIIILCLFVILIVFIAIIKMPKNYTKEYKIDSFNIVEKYNKKIKAYYFIINNKYEYSTIHKYKRKNKIDSIKYIKNTNKKCISIEGKLDFYPLCYDKGQYSYIIDENAKKKVTQLDKDKNIKVQKYKNINIENLLNKNVYIWNHKGYYFLNNKKNKSIEFLDNEYYFNDTAFKTDRYLVTPDYKQKYEFDKFYITNLKTGKTKDMKLKDKLSYNFYYLGDYKNKSFIVDRKSEEEYVLKLKSRKIKLITSKENNGIIYDNKFKEISMTKLINNDYKFNKPNAFSYKIDKKKLYLNYYKSNNDILVSKKNIDKIISYDDEYVYYLVNDTIYAYSIKYGEIKMLSFTELDFNSNNQIFIY